MAEQRNFFNNSSRLSRLRIQFLALLCPIGVTLLPVGVVLKGGMLIPKAAFIVSPVSRIIFSLCWGSLSCRTFSSAPIAIETHCNKLKFEFISDSISASRFDF
ncbi:hypothetical protein D3C80_1337440 [compost metagenome]